MEMGGMGRRTCNYKLQLRVTYCFLFTSPTSCKVSPSLTAWLHRPLTGCHLFRSSAFPPEPQARHFHVSQNSTASQESNAALRRTSLLFSATDAKKFEEASKNGNLVPRHKCLFSYQLTPVLAYRCLVKEDDREAPSFLFKSVEQSTQGRYSVVGAQPAMEIVAKENKVTALDHEGGCSLDQFVEQDPMAVPKRISENCLWTGGWVEFFSYDTVRYVEKKRLPFSKAPEDDKNLPDMHLGLYDDVIVYDHVEKKVYVRGWIGTPQWEKPLSMERNDWRNEWLDFMISTRLKYLQVL